MPPVLNVPCDELAGSGSQKMLTRDSASGRRKRHNVLQLIAKSIGSAQLIEPRAGPNTAAKRLVKHPSANEQIQFTIRRLNLDRIQDLIPSGCNFSQYSIHIFGSILDN